MTSDKVVLLHVQTHLANLGDHHSDFLGFYYQVKTQIY